MTRLHTPLLVLLVTSCVGGDGGTVDAAGNYTLAITNGQNECMFMDWMEGDTASGIPFNITQDGDAVTGDVSGVPGAWMDLWLGASTFTGDVSGNTLVMTLYGTRSASEGNCTWTINAEATADLDGDVLNGHIDYTYATNQAPDCGYRDTCITRQAFNGTRPPQ